MSRQRYEWPLISAIKKTNSGEQASKKRWIQASEQQQRHDLQFKWQIIQLIATRLVAIFDLLLLPLRFLPKLPSTINSRLILPNVFLYPAFGFMISFRRIFPCKCFSCWSGYKTAMKTNTSFTIRCAISTFNIPSNCQLQL